MGGLKALVISDAYHFLLWKILGHGLTAKQQRIPLPGNKTWDFELETYLALMILV